MLLVLVAALIGSVASVMLKAGATRLHRRITSLLFNWRLAVGVFLFVFSSYFFVMGIKKGELTVLYPLVSLGYVFTLFWSKLFFGEKMTRNKIMGLGLIVVGITILAMGGR